MSDPTLILYSQNHWIADDSGQTIWNFTFSDGYIDQSYVKAYTMDGVTKTDLTIVPGQFTGPYQLTITGIQPGMTLVIYRDTPKVAPLVVYSTGARFNANNLDESNRQAIHCIQELADLAGVNLDLDALGFKAMQQNVYENASVVQLVDNGKSHYKSDSSNVTVPNTLPITFLTTIINDGEGVMNIAFDTANVILQGGTDTSPKTVLLLYPLNTLSIMKVRDGRFYASGKAATS